MGDVGWSNFKLAQKIGAIDRADNQKMRKNSIRLEINGCVHGVEISRRPRELNNGRY